MLDLSQPFISWDIETDNRHGHGLNPQLSAVTNICAAVYDFSTGIPLPAEVRSKESFIFSESAVMDPDGEPGAPSKAEADLIGNFTQWLWHLRYEAHNLVGWNSAVFDAPFVFWRTGVNRVPDSLSLSFDPSITPKYEAMPGFHGGYNHSVGPLVSVDLSYMDSLDRESIEDRGIRFGLKPVAKSFGFDPIELDREKLHTYSPEMVEAYNLSDVRCNAAIVAGVNGSRAR